MITQPTWAESAAMPNSSRMSGNAGSMRSIASALIAMSAVRSAMNSRPLAVGRWATSVSARVRVIVGTGARFPALRARGCRLTQRVGVRRSGAMQRQQSTTVRLLEPLSLGARSAKNRIVFGPIVTNLGDDDRSISDRHVAFYGRLARGGVGTIVIDEASVHDSDWPYERAPLAARCAAGWAAVATACHAHGALAIAGLGHAGGQGSSAYSQRELWAPSRVPEVNSREVPKWMEPEDITAVVDGFAAAARLAIDRGCDGVEVNAGQHSLVRQFLSGLTNHRDDEWGTDRLRFARDVLSGVRSAIGSDAVLGLRLSCDELAPWAGMTPEMAPGIAAALAEPLDYLVVVRGAIFSVEKTRPDLHEPPGFNIEVCRAVRAAVPERVAVVLQGSVVDPAQAERAVADGVCDAVEMTRAHLADPDLVGKLVAGMPARIRPCLLCNQACQVRDVRNPIISCVVEPSTGRETEDPDWYRPAAHPRDVIVVGGGPAGLEAARVAAERGHRVRVVERDDHLGGVAAITPPGGPFVDWASAELERLGVEVALGTTGAAAMADGPTSAVVIQCTGSVRGAPTATRGSRVRTRSTSTRSGPARCRSPQPATSSCSTRSADRSPSGSPRSSASALSSSPRTTSPATSSPAPATWHRRTCACNSAACASCGGPCPAPSGRPATVRAAAGSRST